MDKTKKVSVFKTIFEKTPEKTLSFKGWKEFVDFFEKLSKLPGEKPDYSSPGKTKGVPLITPAIFQGNSRKNSNVIAWAGWCALDIDDNEGLDLQNFLTKFEEFNYICYSTGSATESNPKCRLIFPLTDYVPNKHIKHFWYALNKILGEKGDKQTKDYCRLFYIPAQYKNAYNFFYSNRTGKTLSPQKLLDEIPYKPATGNSFISKFPVEIQQEILAYRYNKLRNTGITWSGYKDCPFVNAKMLQEYKKIRTTGWYHKMYQLMVSIAGNAIALKYPITPTEIETLCREIDQDTGNWYNKRPMQIEAERAINYVLQKDENSTTT